MTRRQGSTPSAATGNDAAEGANARARPAWLPVPLRFALYAGLIVAVVALWFWRQSVRPPLPDLADRNPDLAAAVERAAEAVRGDPRSSDAWGRLALLYLAHDFDVEALECLDEAMRLAPLDARWPRTRARALRDADSDAALAALGHAYRLANATERTSVGLELAELQAEQGDGAGAAAVLSALRESSPASGPVELAWGRLLVQQGRHDEAAVALAHAAGDVRTQHAACELLARVELLRGRQPESQSWLARAASLPPDPPTIDFVDYQLAALRTGRGALIVRLTDAQRRGDAREVDRLLLESGGRFPELEHLVRGRLLLERSQPAEAAGEIEAALAIDPRWIDALLSLAAARAALGDTDRAEAALRQAIAVEATHGGAWRGLGLLLERLGRAEEALEAFRAAVRYQPLEAQNHRGLARCLREAGEPSAALVHDAQADRLADAAPRPTE